MNVPSPFLIATTREETTSPIGRCDTRNTEMPERFSRERHSLRFGSELPTLTPWPHRRSLVYLIIYLATRPFCSVGGPVATGPKRRNRSTSHRTSPTFEGWLADRYFRKRMLARAGIRVGDDRLSTDYLGMRMI